MRKWTDSQLQAISTSHSSDGSGCNILVGAAAGSGKTAVLVERIIRKIIPENISESTDIDRLLVVTFTNAAAREMKERIENALQDNMSAALEEKNYARINLIRRQQLLLPAADITTIDSFCLKLIRKYFNLLDIDPGFSVADKAQAEILSDEVIENLFSELYESGDEEFSMLLSLYASSRSDEPLAKLIKYIYNFLRSVANPTDWLEKNTKQLEMNITETAWYKTAQSICARNIECAAEYARQALEMICETTHIDAFLPDNPPVKGIPAFDEWKSYYKAFYSDYLFLTRLLNLPFEDAAKEARNYSFPRLTRLDAKPESEKNYLKELRGKEKDTYLNISKFLAADTDEVSRLSRENLYPVMKALSNLIQKYDAAFMQKKTEKNVFEFSDTEQLAHKLLSEFPETAEEIRNGYSEILMDEYQDTNGLQEAIFSLISNGENLFTVGDMKQSIYRFRSSDPTIFKEKSDSYSPDAGTKNRKIILSKNFRSRGEVLESINDIFETIMSEDAGELDYDEDQRLYTGNTDYTAENPDYKSRCIIIKSPQSDEEDDDDVSRPELEARAIAAEINRLKAENFKVRDGNTYRTIENRDIVILMSSHKNVADIFTAELNDAGIECFAESDGYFEKNEIRLVLALLKIIDNPYADIPLISVLRSPIGGFSDDELVLIRKQKKGRFFGALKEYSRQNSAELDEENRLTVQKSVEFLQKLTRWRNYAHIMPSDKLIWTLYEETDFYAFAGAMHNGDEAQANLRLLFQRAKQFEDNGFEGLFGFIKYIEHLEQRDTDMSSAKLVGEGHNVVRIMTIHKSKGLEFPVVFIAGIGKKFRKSEDESRIALHRKYGIALDYINPEESYRYTPPEKDMFKLISSAEQISEEIRKLYVAATRAKELLYAVGAVKGDTENGENKFIAEKKRQIRDGICTFMPQEVLSAKCFADWIVPVSMVSTNWHFTELNYKEISVSQAVSENKVEEMPEIDLGSILNFTYKYQDASEFPTKVSASSLNESEVRLISEPAFIKSTETGARYGTVLHKIMEHFIPAEDMDAAYVQSAVRDMISRGLLPKDAENTVKPEKILGFYRSDLGRRIMKSKNVMREKAFEVLTDANILYPETDSGEKIILQGVIDCCFEEDGEMVLVDYKTDIYSEASEIHEKYDRQLNAYAYALQKILKKNVKEKFFYLFFDNSVI